MSTAKSRINISVTDDVKIALKNLAKRDRMPAATKAARLIEIGLETEEDEYWDRLATERDKKNPRLYTYDEVFKS